MDELIKRPWGHRVTIADVAAITGAYFGLSKADLMGRARKRKIARPRQIIMTLVREFTTWSRPKIGQWFGGRDNTTVLAGERNIARLDKSDDEIHRDMNELRGRLEQWRQFGCVETTPKNWEGSRAYSKTRSRTPSPGAARPAKPTPLILPVGVSAAEARDMRFEFANSSRGMG